MNGLSTLHTAEEAMAVMAEMMDLRNTVNAGDRIVARGKLKTVLTVAANGVFVLGARSGTSEFIAAEKISKVFPA